MKKLNEQELDLEMMRDLWRGITGNAELNVEEVNNDLVVKGMLHDDIQKLFNYYNRNGLFFNIREQYLGKGNKRFNVFMDKANVISFENNGKKWNLK